VIDDWSDTMYPAFVRVVYARCRSCAWRHGSMPGIHMQTDRLASSHAIVHVKTTGPRTSKKSW